MRDAFASGSQGVSRMFDELTNQDDVEEGPKGEKRSPRVTGEKVAGDAKWGGDEDDMELFFDGP
jgi:histone demethylase JARID1